MAKSNEQTPSYPVVEMVINAIADWVNRHRNSTRTSADLQQCDPQEVMRMVSDLGVTPGQLHDLARREPGSADLLQKMLAALDVDPMAIAQKEPLVMRDLQRLCATCADKNRCEHELAAGSAAEHFHEFCPNAFTLDALLEEKRLGMLKR